MKHPSHLPILRRIIIIYVSLVVTSFTLVAIAPGAVFLTVENVAPEDAALGEPVPFEFCRYSRVGVIRAVGVRTVREVMSVSGDTIPAVEYKFPFTVEDRGCIDLFLTPTASLKSQGAISSLLQYSFQ